MIKKCIYTLTCVAFLIGVIIGIVELRCYDRSFYAEEYSKLETYDYIGISEEDLKETTDVLLSYMEGKRDDMVVYATINGKNREVFNEREKLHMVDVVRLLKFFDAFKYVSYGVFAIILCYVFTHKDYRCFGKMSLIGVILLLILLGGIGGFVAIDFNRFWIVFHKVLFTNDLWLLDPYTDVMIQMFPEEFFEELVKQIVVLSVGSVAIFAGIGFGMSRRKESVGV